jgi:hypothetical protein
MDSVPTGLLGTSTSKVQANQEGLKFNGAHYFWSKMTALDYWAKTNCICVIKKKTDSFLVIRKELGLGVNNEKLSIYSCLVNRLQEKMAA